MAHSLRYLMVAFTLATGLRAQTTGSAFPLVRFTVFSARPISDLAFTPRPTATPEKVQFYPTARSPRYEFRGAMPVRFVDSTSGAVVAEANIPAGIRDALLLFTPIESAGTKTAAGTLRYQISVLDDGAARQTEGLAIINLSGLALSGTVNQTKITLKPGLNPTVPMGQVGKIALRTMVKERTFSSYSATVQLGRNERALLILFPPFYKGSVEVQSRLLVDQPPGMAPTTPKSREK